MISAIAQYPFFKDGDFFAFEAGFRFSGEHSYDYQRCTQGNDYMIDMLHYHLGLPLPPRSTNRNNLMMLSYNLYVNTPNEDIIKYVDLGDLASQQSIKTITTYVHAGTQIKKNVPTKVAMCNIVDKDKELISKSISLINESVCIKGIGGKLELFSPKKELLL